MEDKANFVTSAKNGIVTVLYAYFPFGDIVACVKRETEHVNTSCALNAAAWSEVNPFFALNTITMMLLYSVVYKYICVLCVFAAFLLLLLHSFCKCVVEYMCEWCVCQNCSKLHSQLQASFFARTSFKCHHHHVVKRRSRRSQTTMLPTHIGGGSGQGGGVNANNFTTNDPESGGGLSHSFIDDNDENKYRTKEKSFLPPGGTHMRQLFLFLFTQKKARVAFEVVRFFVVALFFRWLVVKVVFEDGNEDEDHPGSVLSTSKTGGGGKRYSNNNKNENKYHHSLLDGEDNMFPFPEYDNLVIVTGHSVYSGSDYMRAGEENSWFLEEYQMHAGTANALVEQIKVGVETAARDGKAILLFSGGKTRKLGGQVSEGSSYWQVSRAYNWFGEMSVEKRAFTEEYARDSFENLMFSMCRFYELTGKYPMKTTVVGYDFKRERFEELHAKALKIPSVRFAFVGTPEVMSFKKQFVEGEVKVRSLFEKDAYGCEAPLSEKRKLRDPFAVGAPYEARCPEMQGALSVCKRAKSKKAGSVKSMIKRVSLPWE